MGGRGNSGSRNSGSRNTLPRYSNEKGIILDSTVKADSRYDEVEKIFDGFKRHKKNYQTGGTDIVGSGYLAKDFLRTLMSKEEKGETSGSMYINIWDGESLKNKMAVYKAALKASGYKVTSQENDDVHYAGYMGVRGRRVYASTSRARTLYYEKVR